jgi:hypothetical protein
MPNKIYKWWVDLTTRPRKNLQLVYTDKKFNRWYIFRDFTMIHYTRLIAAETALRHTEFNLTKEQLLKLLHMMKAFGDAGQIVNMFGIIAELEQRIEYAAEEETLLQLACCYTVFNDEPDLYDPSWQKTKLAVLKKDINAKNFFLQLAWQSTKKYSNMSDLDILEYLKTTNDRLEELLTLCPNPSITT